MAGSNPFLSFVRGNKLAVGGAMYGSTPKALGWQREMLDTAEYPFRFGVLDDDVLNCPHPTHSMRSIITTAFYCASGWCHVHIPAGASLRGKDAVVVYAAADLFNTMRSANPVPADQKVCCASLRTIQAEMYDLLTTAEVNQFRDRVVTAYAACFNAHDDAQEQQTVALMTLMGPFIMTVSALFGPDIQAFNNWLMADPRPGFPPTKKATAARQITAANWDGLVQNHESLKAAIFVTIAVNKDPNHATLNSRYFSAVMLFLSGLSRVSAPTDGWLDKRVTRYLESLSLDAATVQITPDQVVLFRRLMKITEMPTGRLSEHIIDVVNISSALDIKPVGWMIEQAAFNGYTIAVQFVKMCSEYRRIPLSLVFQAVEQEFRQIVKACLTAYFFPYLGLTGQTVCPTTGYPNIMAMVKDIQRKDRAFKRYEGVAQGADPATVAELRNTWESLSEYATSRDVISRMVGSFMRSNVGRVDARDGSVTISLVNPLEEPAEAPADPPAPDQNPLPQYPPGIQQLIEHLARIPAPGRRAPRGVPDGVNNDFWDRCQVVRDNQITIDMIDLMTLYQNREEEVYRRFAASLATLSSGTTVFNIPAVDPNVNPALTARERLRRPIPAAGSELSNLCTAVGFVYNDIPW